MEILRQIWKSKFSIIIFSCSLVGAFHCYKVTPSSDTRTIAYITLLELLFFVLLFVGVVRRILREDEKKVQEKAIAELNEKCRKFINKEFLLKTDVGVIVDASYQEVPGLKNLYVDTGKYVDGERFSFIPVVVKGCTIEFDALMPPAHHVDEEVVEVELVDRDYEFEVIRIDDDWIYVKNAVLHEAKFHVKEYSSKKAGDIIKYNFAGN